MATSPVVIDATTLVMVNNTLVPLDQIQRLPRNGYVEGAIELVVNNHEMLTREETESVDELWAYLLNGVEARLDGSAFECFFPSQPVPVSMTPVDKQRMRFAVRDRAVVVFTREFCGELAKCVEGAMAGFARASNGGNRQMYLEQERRARQLFLRAEAVGRVA